MSVTCGFFDSVNGDRKYNASQLSSLFNGIINDGVFMSIGDTFMVSAEDGMNVSIGTGRAWFNGTWTNNDAELVLTLEPSELILHRYDAIIIEVNTNPDTRTNTIKVLKGIPSSTPVNPVLTRTEFLNQYALAYIYVGAGATDIIPANITNRVGTTGCPFVTGILETIDATALLAQWDSQFTTWMANVDSIFDGNMANYDSSFDTWFQSVQNILDESTAGNLLNLIDEHKVDYVAHPANGGTTAGSSTAYACVSNPAPTQLVDMIGVVITVHTDSGSNPTLNWNALGSKPIKKPNGNAATLKSGGIYTLRYSAASGNFILQGEGASGNAVASNLLSGKTASTDAGDIVGTMIYRSNYVTCLSYNSLGSTLRFKPQAGYYDGVNSYTTQYDNNWVEGNIRTGVSIFGKTGTCEYGTVYPITTENLLGGNDVTTTNKQMANMGNYLLIASRGSSTINVYNLGTYTLTQYTIPQDYSHGSFFDTVAAWGSLFVLWTYNWALSGGYDKYYNDIIFFDPSTGTFTTKSHITFFDSYESALIGRSCCVDSNNYLYISNGQRRYTTGTQDNNQWYKIGPLTTGDMTGITPTLIATTPVANKRTTTNGQLYYYNGFLYSMDSYTNTIKVEIATGTLTVLNNSTLAVIDDETGAWAGANGIFSVMYGDYGSYNTYRYNITDNNFYSAAYPPNIFRTGAMCSSQDGKYIYAYSHVTITEHNGLVRRCCLVKYKPT